MIRPLRRSASWIKQRPGIGLLLLSVVTAQLYLALLALGPAHTLATPAGSRPILLVIGIYAAAFVPYWLAWWLAAHAEQSRLLLWWLVGTSVLWRVILLPTPPFQEIDIYRYLWDGGVARHGWDPYQYSPQQVIDAIDAAQQAGHQASELGGTGSLPGIVDFATRVAPEYEVILREVHFGELPSPYPPVSQAVFAAASLTSPASTAQGHLRWLKLVLTGFDVATLLLVVWLLRMTQQHLGHAVAYGWCPLVMKEIAGSGHLDSIATFFAILAVALTVCSLKDAHQGASRLLVVGGALALAAGVAAKLFPIVLAPLLLLVWLRKLGWSAAAVGLFAFGSSASLLLAAMLIGVDSQPSAPVAAKLAATESERLPPPPANSNAEQREIEKTDGLSAFLTQWEMNDLLFAVTVENLRPQDQVKPRTRPWFVIVPDAVSTPVVDAWRVMAGSVWPPARQWTRSRASFLLARMLTGGVFVLIAIVLSYRATRTDAEPTALLSAAFLTLAWFWLLAPTQNPWYWCWALPLLPFARSRAWALLAACVLLYYLRFWLEIHIPAPPAFGTVYDGEYFFYFVVSWIEFGPWLLLLAIETLLRRTGAK